MSNLQTRIQIRNEYAAVAEMLREIAWAGDRFDIQVLKGIEGPLLDLCAKVRAHPEITRVLAKNLGAELMQWYSGQWPKRNLDEDETPKFEPLAKAYTALASELVDALHLENDHCVQNIIGIHPSFDRFMADRIISLEMGLKPYCLISTDSYDEYEYLNQEQINGNALSRTAHYLMAAGSHEPLDDLLSALNETLAQDGSIMDIHSRLHFFNGIFVSAGTITHKGLFENLRTLLGTPDVDVVKQATERQGEQFYRSMIMAARSGMREQVEPFIEMAIAEGNPVTGYRQMIADIERHTGVDPQILVTRLIHQMEGAFNREDILKVLLTYYAVTEKPVINDLIEFDISDHYYLSQVVRNEYNAFYDSQDYSLNMKNVKMLMCEFLGQHSGQLQLMANDSVISHIVKTLPYWYDHQFATDLGL